MTMYKNIIISNNNLMKEGVNFFFHKSVKVQLFLKPAQVTLASTSLIEQNISKKAFNNYISYRCNLYT